MKRFIIFIFAAVSVLSSVAAGFSAKQEELRTDIEGRLKSKGYTVERRDDGLMFVSDGDKYFIEIDESATKPMYVRLCRYVNFDDNIKRDSVLKQLNALNSTPGIKVYCKEKKVIFAAEMFVTSPTQFNNALYDLLSLMKKVYSKIAPKG